MSRNETHRAALLERFADPIPVLDKGYVKLVDVMGCDADIASAARNSYVGNTEEERTREEDQRLIRRLFRDRHSGVFEMCEIKLQVRCPIDVARQWFRSRTWSYNEYSTRYRPAISDKATTDPAAWRLQSTDNKQGSAGLLDGDQGALLSAQERGLHERIAEVYEDRVERGVAFEQARKDLPMSNYTEFVGKVDARNLFHFLSLRLDPHAQQEIRAYADVIFGIAKAWLPIATRAFFDYQLEAVTFSRMEREIVKDLARVFRAAGCGRDFIRRRFDAIEEESGITIPPSERKAFYHKIGMGRLLDDAKGA